jgi:epoxyqueuosine reductase
LTAAERTARIKRKAIELGFQECGITDLSPPPHGDALQRWLTRGMAGTMTYMHRQMRRRLIPQDIVAGATRAVVVTRFYDNPDPPLPPRHGRVAKYARGPDYHDTLATPLAQLADFVKGLGKDGSVARSYVDAGPVPERELAQRAGLGWIGKNTMLIDPKRGSYCFIASVLTDVELAVDAPFEMDRCGSCRRCLDACPTGAFPAERVLDSRLCISYLTIEFKGEIDPGLRQLMGDWIFGCDECQAVCPWNHKFSFERDDAILRLGPALATLDVTWLTKVSKEEFVEKLGSTPLARPGPARMRRNAQICAQNTP